MQFKLFAAAAFAATVASQSTPASTRATPSPPIASAPAASFGINTLSVLSILATAVPESLIRLYATNSKSAEHLIASELQAGSTPGWFQSLPTPVQTYLLGGAGTNYTLSSSMGASNGTAMHNSSTVLGGTTRTKGGKTTVVGGSTQTRQTGGSGPTNTRGSGSGSGASSSSTGGAALPTAVFGAGLAGVVGIVGLFAL